jgi:hypothetical protein
LLPERLRRVLGRPRAAAAVVAIGVLLCAPSLANGLALDDVLQAARFAGGGATAMNLFALFGGEAPLVAAADVPWWTHEAMRLALLRPLTAWTHLIDLRLFAEWPVWMHVHSLLWYAGLLAAAGAVYRRFTGGGHAWVLALALYAADHSHGMVVGWLASRSAVIGALGGLCCLLAHDRWRREGRIRDALISGGALAAALLANEGAIGICGYLLAYALCLERGGWRGRAASLIPAVVIAVVWRACYVAAGFGAAHTGFYFDPGGDVVGFVGRAAVHAVVLVGSQVFVPLGEGLAMVPGLFAPGAAAIAVLLVGVWWAVRGELAGSPTLRFWAIGALLSALPLGTTLPTDRQLLLIGVGVFGFAGAWFAEARPRSRTIRGLAWGWLGLHLGASPLLLPLRAASPAGIHALAEAGTDAVVSDPPPRSVILVRAPSDLVMLYGRASRQLRGLPAPAELQYLYAGLDALTISRVDARTLELRPEAGWLVAPLDRLYRDSRDVFNRGERISHGSFAAEIIDVAPDGRPLVIRVRFDRALEAPDIAWFTWEGRTPRAFVVPAIGETVTSPAQSNPLLSP